MPAKKTTKKQLEQEIENLQLRLKEQENSTELIQHLRKRQAALQTANEALRVVEEELRARTKEIGSSRAELEHTRARYQELFDEAPDGYIVTDPEGMIQDANQEAARLLGRSAADLKNYRIHRVRDFLPAAAIKHALETLSGIGSESILISRWEGPVFTLKGDPFWAAIAVSASRDKNGKIISLRWLIRNITKRKQAEEALRANSSRLNVLLTVSSRVLGARDIQSLLQIVAEASRELTGAGVSACGYGYANGEFREGATSHKKDYLPSPPGEIFCAAKGVAFLDLVHRIESIRLTDSQLRARPDWREMPEGHTPLRGLLGARLSDGSGQATGLIMVSDKEHGGDFTAEDESLLRQLAAIASLALQHTVARQDAENAAEQARWLARFPEDNPNPVMRVSADGLILYQNPATVELPGWNCRNGEPVMEPMASAVARALADERELQIEFSSKDRIFLAWAVPFRSKGYVNIYALDITARKHAEEALHESEGRLKDLNESLEKRVNERTMEAERRALQLRQLAADLTLSEQRERQRLAMILHDGLQQTLVAAKFSLAALERGRDAVGKTEEISGLIDDCIETSRSLTSELSPPVLFKGGLLPALEWLVRHMRDRHGLTVKLASREPIKRSGEEINILLFQSVRELLFNVVKHAGTKEVCIEVKQPDGHIEVDVVDDGVGFDAAQLHSKESSRSMGLFSINERLGYCGGRMEVESARGKGSRIRLIAPSAISLEPETSPDPQSDVSVATLSGPRPGKVYLGKIIRVALVDDHVVMRQGLAGLLQTEPDIEIVGEASDGESALSLVRETRPDVVLMDIGMPGMDGVQATKIIHQEMPAIKIIGLSMFQEGEQSASIRKAGAVEYLTKSGPSGAVIGAIRKCMLVAKQAPGSSGYGKSRIGM